MQPKFILLYCILISCAAPAGWVSVPFTSTLPLRIALHFQQTLHLWAVGGYCSGGQTHCSNVANAVGLHSEMCR